MRSDFAFSFYMIFFFQFLIIFFKQKNKRTAACKFLRKRYINVILKVQLITQGLKGEQ